MLNLKRMLAKLCEKIGVIGAVYTAAWTATSNSGYQTPLTNAITLPAGTYVVIVIAPVVSAPIVISAAGRFSTLTSNGSSFTTLLTTRGGSIQVLSAQSANATFSYLERGSLMAIRIA